MSAYTVWQCPAGHRRQISGEMDEGKLVYCNNTLGVTVCPSAPARLLRRCGWQMTRIVSMSVEAAGVAAALGVEEQ